MVFAALAIASTSSVVMSVSRTSTRAAMTRAALRHFGGLVLALQALAAALDGGDELREVHLERVEDLVGVVLGAEADLALAGAGVLDDVLGRALGLLGDLLLGDQLLLALPGLLDDPLGLALGLGQHLLPFLDDPARLLDLLGDRRAHLIEDVVDLLLVHTHLIGQRDRLGVVDGVVQLVDEHEDVHSRPLFVSAPGVPSRPWRRSQARDRRSYPQRWPVPGRRSRTGSCTGVSSSGRRSRRRVPEGG